MRKANYAAPTAKRFSWSHAPEMLDNKCTNLGLTPNLILTNPCNKYKRCPPVDNEPVMETVNSNQLKSMRLSFSLLFISCLLFCLALASFAQSTNAVTALSQDTNVLQTFKLLLDFPTNTFTNGETVVCHLGLTNMSDNPVSIDPLWVGVNLYFLVTKPSGLKFRSEHDYFSGHPYLGPEVVPPHREEQFYHWLCPVSEYVTFEAGTYQVSVEREAASRTNDMTYTSSVVTITILPPLPPNATNGPASRTN
jgi:hypothetical protein